MAVIPEPYGIPRCGGMAGLDPTASSTAGMPASDGRPKPVVRRASLRSGMGEARFKTGVRGGPRS